MFVEDHAAERDARSLDGDLHIHRGQVQREIVEKLVPSFRFVAIHITSGNVMIDPDGHSLVSSVVLA